MFLSVSIVAAVLSQTAHGVAAAQQEDLIRVGIIGLDTSHVVAFTKAMNDDSADGALAAVRVVAAYPGGSPDIPASRDRIAGFTADLSARGVTMVDTIAELLDQVDAVLLESVDGRPHLDQVRPVFAAGKRVFIDKPLAGSLEDAVEIYRLGREHQTPWFSSSSLRFSPGYAGLNDDAKLGEVVGCQSFGPCKLEPHHPDLFWYGIHGVEILFTAMGPGCVTVTRAQSEGTDLVTGTWKDGRIGTFRGIRAGKSDYGALVFGAKQIRPLQGFAGYGPLVEAIARFFAGGAAPVSPEQTLEIYAFMEAAHESGRRKGQPVDVAQVLRDAGFSR